MKNRTKGIVKMVSAAMLALLGLGGWAQTARAAADTDEAAAGEHESATHGPGRAKHDLTGKVSAVDKASSTLVIMDKQGNRTAVQAPGDNLDRVKAGDTVAVTYQEPIAVGITTSGESQKKAGAKPNEMGAGGSCAGITEASGNVISVDEHRGEITFRAAGGDIHTVSTAAFPAVQEKLAKLHPGDLVQVNYTQPVATKVTVMKKQ